MIGRFQLEETEGTAQNEEGNAYDPKQLAGFLKRLPVRRVVHLPHVSADPVNLQVGPAPPVDLRNSVFSVETSVGVAGGPLPQTSLRTPSTCRCSLLRLIELSVLLHVRKSLKHLVSCTTRRSSRSSCAAGVAPATTEHHPGNLVESSLTLQRRI